MSRTRMELKIEALKHLLIQPLSAYKLQCAIKTNWKVANEIILDLEAIEYIDKSKGEWYIREHGIEWLDSYDEARIMLDQISRTRTK